MILAIELLSVIILAMILWTIVTDERKKYARNMREVKLKGFWDGTDRRGGERLNVSLAVKYYVNGTGVDTKSADISARGIRLLLDEKFEEGTPLRLEIKLPECQRILRSYATVVWSSESPEDEIKGGKRFFNTGLRFYNFQEEDEGKLFDFMYKFQPRKR